MKVEAEQFLLPLAIEEQSEMCFMAPLPFCPFWAFAWWAVLHVRCRPIRAAGRFAARFRSDLPSMVTEIEKARKHPKRYASET